MEKITRILIVTRNLPPLVGGMERLNLQICRLLSTHFDISVAGPKGSAVFHQIAQFVEFSAQPLWRYVLSSVYATLRLTLRLRPDIILCGSGAAILAGYLASRLVRAKLVCYLHGLDILAANPIYQRIFLPLIRRSHLVFVNSNNTCQLAVHAGIAASKINILHPGVDMPTVGFVNQRSDQPTTALTPTTILIVGRLTARKGIVEFIQHIMPRLVLACPTVKLDIIGCEPANAIQRSAGIANAIREKTESLHLEAYVNLRGYVDDVELQRAYRDAAILAFPILDLPGDVEGFGMVAVEAAAQGLPTIGFAVGGVPDAVAEGKSGWLVGAGDYQKMADILFARLNNPDFGGITSATCVAHAKEFAWSNFERKMIEALSTMVMMTSER